MCQRQVTGRSSPPDVDHPTVLRSGSGADRGDSGCQSGGHIEEEGATSQFPAHFPIVIRPSYILTECM